MGVLIHNLNGFAAYSAFGNVDYSFQSLAVISSRRGKELWTEAGEGEKPVYYQAEEEAGEATGWSAAEIINCLISAVKLLILSFVPRVSGSSSQSTAATKDKIKSFTALIKQFIISAADQPVAQLVRDVLSMADLRSAYDDGTDEGDGKLGTLIILSKASPS